MNNFTIYDFKEKQGRGQRKIAIMEIPLYFLQTLLRRLESGPWEDYFALLLGSKHKRQNQEATESPSELQFFSVMELILVIFHLRDPALAGLNCEEGEHGHEAIVVMKVPPVPFPNMNNGRQIWFNVLKVHSPEKGSFYISYILIKMQM